MSLTKLSLAGNNLPARESLVSDIPAGDGKWLTFFYSVTFYSVFRRSLVIFGLNTCFHRFGGLGMWECSLKSKVVVSIAYPMAYILTEQI